MSIKATEMYQKSHEARGVCAISNTENTCPSGVNDHNEPDYYDYSWVGDEKARTMLVLSQSRQSRLEHMIENLGHEIRVMQNEISFLTGFLFDDDYDVPPPPKRKDRIIPFKS